MRDDFYNTLLIIKNTVFLSIEKDTLFFEVMQRMQKTRPWAILAAGAAIQVLTGLPAAWGVFQKPVMEEYGLSEQGAGYAFALAVATYTKKGNQWVFGCEMLQRNNPYRNTYVPLSQYTGEGGYYHTILSTSGKSFFLNLGASALLGYEAVNNGNRLLDDGQDSPADTPA